MIELFGKNPNTMGLVHFIGIGGIGMSGLAEILHDNGFTVQGSDLSENANVKRLKAKGVEIFYGHGAAYIEKAFRVVISSAIPDDNPELVAAKKLGLRVMHRSEILAEILSKHNSIAIAGTHGKTTTTSLVFTLLDYAKTGAGVINGGVIYAIGSNIKASTEKGGLMVAEADESDGSFTKISSKIAVITNMDAEHMEYYKSMDNMRQAYEKFATNTPEGTGTIILGIDHHEVAALAQKLNDRKVVTYGFLAEADISARNLRQNGAAMVFDLMVKGKEYTDFRLNMPGKHNVLNSLAAIAVAIECGVDVDNLRPGLLSFKGVGRRFIKMGMAHGALVIDDYAHHPVEIKATIRGTKQGFINNKVVAVIQPHRYSRLQDLFEEFSKCADDADEVVIVPVYAAGEKPIDGISHETLAKKMKENGVKSVHTVQDHKELSDLIPSLVTDGDIILCMGAGNINAWGQFLVKTSRSIQ
ncbi:MAG: UDP-N-acetylmuramate--alanine ligase [Alphaproteobacteria bacterium]|jgi:UDP-N-acetylmuramate--alanine ligase